MNAISQKPIANWGKAWLNLIQILLRLFCRYIHHFHTNSVILPKDQGVIVVSNHISGLDPILMVLACDRPLRFLIASEEYQRFGLRWFFRQIGCIPVDRASRPEVALRAAKKALAAGEVLALFPQGHIHIKSVHPPLKKGAVWLATQGDYPIVALHIRGVAGSGQTISAILKPSPKVELFAHPPWHCQHVDKACLDKMQAQILSES